MSSAFSNRRERKPCGTAAWPRHLSAAISSAMLLVYAAFLPAQTFAQPSKLVVTQGPASAVVGRVFTTGVIVEVRDANNLLVTGTPVAVSLAVANGVLSGNVTRTTINGQAVFTDFGDSLRVNVAGANTITATSGALQVGTWDFTVSAAPTQTTLSSSPSSSSVYGQPITFTATVAPQSPGEGSPTGIVRFKNGATELGTGTLNGSGQAAFTTSSLGVGSYNVTAEYAGDDNFLTSSSPSTGYAVNQSAVNIAFTPAFSTTLSYNQGVTFTATVTAKAPGGGTPSGTVEVRDTDTASTVLATILLDATGNGSKKVFLAPRAAPYTPTAYYLGDGNFALGGNQGGAVLQITKGGATIAVTASQASIPAGASVTLTGSVTGPNGAAIPTGIITFLDGGTIIGTATMDSTGKAAINPVLGGGEHQITVQYGGDTIYEAGTSDPGTPTTVTVVTTTTTVSSTGIPSTYGDSVTFTATVSSSTLGTISGDVQFSVDGLAYGSPVPLSGGTAAITVSSLSRGLRQITATYTGDATFGGSASAPLTQTVNPKQLTISGLTAQYKVYDGALAATLNGTPSLSGVLTADDVSLTGTASGTFISKDIGTSIQVDVAGLSLTGTAAVNYTLAPLTLTANITAKPLKITGVTASDKAYDGTAMAALSGGTLNGVIGTEDVTFTQGTGTFASPDVGTRTVTASGYALTGSAAGNYSLAQPVVPNAVISPAPVIIASGIAADSKVYDRTTVATISSYNVVLSGVVSGDQAHVTLSTNGYSASFSNATVGVGKSVTLSGLSLTGAAAGNYSLTTLSGLTADITAKPVTISGVTTAGKTYDGTASAALSGGTLSGVISSDVVTMVIGTGSFASANVGTWAVTANGFDIEGADASNYVLASQPTVPNAAISAVTVTITSGITADSKIYDRTTAATISSNNVVLAGIIPADASNVSLSTNGYSASFSSATAGTAKPVTVSGLTLTGSASGNYSLTQPSGLTADISKKSVTISGVTAADKTYDRTTPATLSGGTLNGVISPDVVTISAGTGVFASANVGAWPVTASGYALTGADAGNYLLVAQPNVLSANITPKSLTITGVTANNKTYDGTTTASLSGTAALSGVVAGDTVTLGGTVSASFSSAGVGTAKPVTVSGYTIGGASAGNYTLSQPTGLTANITAKALTVSGITASDKVYDRTTTATINTSAAALVGVVSGDTVTLSTAGASGSFASATVGNNKTVTIAGLTIGGGSASNYTLTQPTTTASITPVTLTISGVSANSKVYNGTTAATLSGTASLVGVISGDTVTLGGTPTAVFSTASVGNNIPVTVSGYTISGASAVNYSLNQPSGLVANITPKTLTITGITANNKTYDGTTTASLSGTAAPSGVVAGTR